ncbi:MAG: hypothetical protein SGJ15_05900 [Bacteroidota bacterium]|nr:hypothetical protein [Bacteroidota bacterium]
MESNKHNDELIKRKLDGVSIEPRKLKFAEVKANYEKAKDASSNKWGLYFIIGGLGLAVFLSAYFMLNSDSEKNLADNNSPTAQVMQAEPLKTQNANSTSNASTDQNTIHSVGTTNKDKLVERKNSEASVSETVAEETNTIKEAKETSVAKTSNDTKIASNSKTNSDIKEVKPVKKSTSSSSVPENSSTEEKKSTNLSSKESRKNTTTKSVDNTSSKNNDLLARTKNSENKPIIKGKVRSSGFNSTTPSKKSKDPKIEKAVKNSTETISGNSSDQTKALETKSINNTKNENKTTRTEKKEPLLLDQENQNSEKTNEDAISKEQNKKVEVTKASETNTLATSNPVANSNTFVTKSVDNTNTVNAKTNEAIGSGSVSPRNKHQFILSTEIVYTSISYQTKANPKAPSQFNQGEPGFINTYVNAMGTGKYKLFNGSAFLSYVYNEGFGISTGIGFFNLETKVNTAGFGSKKNVTMFDSLVHAFDSSMNWIVIDTVYKTVTTGNNAVVNGDTVRNQDYLNNIRFYTIPFKIHYNIKLTPKFSIEPQAGVLMAIPLNSNQLVASKAYSFAYTKTKNNLNPKIMYFDLSLKLGYKISNNAQLYIKQGYFFRNRSIYNSDSPIELSLKSLYTSFGIAIRLK